jgi:phenylacetate-CoA ligase
VSIAVFLKNNLKNIPVGLGQIINKVPYGRRPGIGDIYLDRKNQINYFDKADSKTKKEFAFQNMKRIVDFAYGNIVFYKEFYDEMNFKPNELKSFDDIEKIPIITKSILNKYNIDDRSFLKKGRYVVNTGGSSGTPFSFYIEPSSMGHEWAHMHTIWEKLNFRPKDLKLVFGGRSDVSKGIEYDVVRNHFALDIYADYDEIAPKLIGIVKKYKIKYLHGYPSSIYDFAKYCEESNHELRDLLKVNLKGAFLGSEYPHKHYRETIERVFNITTISWYGHTERAVLAYEKDEMFTYEPFLTYGYAEALLNGDSQYELIGTSWYNESSPLIRYNTQDIIEEPIIQNNILKSFKILKGREGEFVIDRVGKKINLTGLIFGRHHQIFNHSKFIQVKQIEKGEIEIFYVSELEINDAVKLFDTKNLDFDIKFVKISEPIRTISGKVSLLIK